LPKLDGLALIDTTKSGDASAKRWIEYIRSHNPDLIWAKARGNDYGLSRLSRRIRTARGKVDDVLKAILADIDNHCGDQDQQGDDMTIVAMSIDQRRAKRKTTTLPGVSPGEGGSARLTTEGGTEAPDTSVERERKD